MSDELLHWAGKQIDADRIQRLREWCERGHYHPSNLSDWQRGFLTARREVRQLLDGTDE